MEYMRDLDSGYASTLQDKYLTLRLIEDEEESLSDFSDFEENSDDEASTIATKEEMDVPMLENKFPHPVLWTMPEVVQWVEECLEIYYLNQSIVELEIDATKLFRPEIFSQLINDLGFQSKHDKETFCFQVGQLMDQYFPNGFTEIKAKENEILDLYIEFNQMNKCASVLQQVHRKWKNHVQVKKKSRLESRDELGWNFFQLGAMMKERLFVNICAFSSTHCLVNVNEHASLFLSLVMICSHVASIDTFYAVDEDYSTAQICRSKVKKLKRKMRILHEDEISNSNTVFVNKFEDIRFLVEPGVVWFDILSKSKYEREARWNSVFTKMMTRYPKSENRYLVIFCDMQMLIPKEYRKYFLLESTSPIDLFRGHVFTHIVLFSYF